MFVKFLYSFSPLVEVLKTLMATPGIDVNAGAYSAMACIARTPKPYTPKLKTQNLGLRDLRVGLGLGIRDPGALVPVPDSLL